MKCASYLLKAPLQLQVICTGMIVASKRAPSSSDVSFDSTSESLSAEDSSDSSCPLSYSSSSSVKFKRSISKYQHSDSEISEWLRKFLWISEKRFSYENFSIFKENCEKKK